MEGQKDPESKEEPGLEYVQYEPVKEEHFLPAIRQLISKDLSEPYSIYVYRYFLYQWGDLCYMVPCSSFLLIFHIQTSSSCNPLLASIFPANTMHPPGPRRQQHPNRRNSLQARTPPLWHIPRLHRHASSTRNLPRSRHRYQPRSHGH